MSRTLLQLFARPPIAGKVKTRLIPDIGAQKALGVYQYCLQFNRQLVLNSRFDLQAWYSEPYQDSQFEAEQLRVQQGNDLGERMFHALGSELRGSNGKYQHVILIGSDCLELSHELLDQVDSHLERHDMVFIPAQDGGYVLVAAKEHIHPLIFEAIPWGSAEVMATTLERAKQAGIDVCLLNSLRDIDRYEDLHHYAPLRQFT